MTMTTPYSILALVSDAPDTSTIPDAYPVGTLPDGRTVLHLAPGATVPEWASGAAIVAGPGAWTWNAVAASRPDLVPVLTPHEWAGEATAAGLDAAQWPMLAVTPPSDTPTE